MNKTPYFFMKNSRDSKSFTGNIREREFTNISELTKILNCNYEEVYNEINKNRFPEPNILLSLEKLRSLTYEIVKNFDWMINPQIEIIDPRCSKHTNRYFTSEEAIPLAHIEQDVIPNTTVKVYAKIEIFNENSCTVGILLHELAHMYDPYDNNHGDNFKQAYDQIIHWWYVNKYREVNYKLLLKNCMNYLKNIF